MSRRKYTRQDLTMLASMLEQIERINNDIERGGEENEYGKQCQSLILNELLEAIKDVHYVR